MTKTKIFLYNTLSGARQRLTPLQPGLVRAYTCGPTVYDFAHIGNFRAYVVADTLVRLLRYLNYEVRWVMNITDLDDKTIDGAAKAGQALSEFTAHYEAAFFEDLGTLNITPADVYPRATEHLPAMRAIISRLLEKGLAYQTTDGVYFDIAKFKDYGRLAGLDVTGLKKGARVSVDSYNKKDARDFALWKFGSSSSLGPSSSEPILAASSAAAGSARSTDLSAQGGTMPDRSRRASSPGRGLARSVGEKPKTRQPDSQLPDSGRPGWHIECSAMSRAYLGQPFDIHTGGVDLIFPHHTNEIAQSVGAYDQPLASMFVHNEHLLVNGQKMSKSLGNFYTLRDISQKGSDPMALRYLYLQSHYREKMNFTFKALDGALQTLAKIRGAIKRFLASPRSTVDSRQTIQTQLTQALSDDLNTPKALSILHEANDPVAWLEFDRVLGLRLTEIGPGITLTDQQQQLIEKRQQLRNQKQFGEADKVRQELEKQGIVIEDTPEGPRVLR